jgi:hypothetical protein
MESEIDKMESHIPLIILIFSIGKYCLQSFWKFKCPEVVFYFIFRNSQYNFLIKCIAVDGCLGIPRTGPNGDMMWMLQFDRYTSRQRCLVFTDGLLLAWPVGMLYVVCCNRASTWFLVLL